MASTARRVPVWLSYGFRPFFLAASLLAAVLIGLWGPVYLGLVSLPASLTPVQWHGYELLFGYVPAVIAGFLLTAIPNWSGRPPINGARLGGLFALWLVGRLAVMAAPWLDAGALAGLALLFPAVFVLVVTRELVLARNWRNLKVVGVLALLGVAQALFHADLVRGGNGIFALRMAVALIVLLIMLIGGRIIPAFTRNWLRKNDPDNTPEREPVDFNRVDLLAMILGALGLVGWLAADHLPAGRHAFAAVLIVAGCANILRMARWAPLRTGAEPLLSVLHLAYAFVPLGFLLAGFGLWRDDPALLMAALHALTIGVILLMTLAVMVRATRGHTNQPLTAPPGTVLVFVAVCMGALGRILAAFLPEHGFMLILIASLVCSVAFLGFVALYARLLLSRP